MRKNFFKKVFISLVLVIILSVIFTGCGTTTPPINPPPATCTLTVYSQSPNCWGYVWVNGLSTGQWIAFNGAVTVTGLTVGTTASVQILDNFGFLSHQEIKQLVGGNNIVIFTYW